MLALAPTVEIPTDPSQLADEIARTAAHLDAATHRLLTCIRAFDESGEWERQGAVSCALCSRHHRLLHEGGFTVKRAATGALAFLDVHGRSVENAPAGVDVGSEWGDTIKRWIAESGAVIDEQTNFPGWDGEPVDYEAAVDAVVG